MNTLTSLGQFQFLGGKDSVSLTNESLVDWTLSVGLWMYQSPAPPAEVYISPSKGRTIFDDHVGEMKSFQPQHRT